MACFVPHHLEIGAEHTQGNGGAGRLFFLPGSEGRAARISQRFSDPVTIPSDRQLNVYLGHLSAGQVDVGVVATGMGCPSLDIVVTELIGLGARHFIRVGTAGSLNPRLVSTGDLVLATAAVRDQGASDNYICKEYPAVADIDVVLALGRAALTCGVADRTFRGVVHSKDSLYAREFGLGPCSAANREYMDQLRRIGVLASEMETAHLLILSDVHSTVPQRLDRGAAGKVRSGAVLAIIGDESAFADGEQVARAEQAAIDVALEAAYELFPA